MTDPKSPSTRARTMRRSLLAVLPGTRRLADRDLVRERWVDYLTTLEALNSTHWLPETHRIRLTPTEPS